MLRTPVESGFGDKAIRISPWFVAAVRPADKPPAPGNIVGTGVIPDAVDPIPNRQTSFAGGYPRQSDQAAPIVARNPGFWSDRRFARIVLIPAVTRRLAFENNIAADSLSIELAGLHGNEFRQKTHRKLAGAIVNRAEGLAARGHGYQR